MSKSTGITMAKEFDMFSAVSVVEFLRLHVAEEFFQHLLHAC